MDFATRFSAAALAAALAVAALAACRSTVDPLAQDLTAEQYFQRAIEASDREDYKLALRYYEAFRVKFPDDVQRNAWAEYEIAFLYHKLGNDAKAVELFDRLLERYAAQKEGDPPLPPGPRVLAEKVKANILKQRKQGGPGTPGGPAAPSAPEAPPASTPATP